MNKDYLTDEERIEAIVSYPWTSEDREAYFIKPTIPLDKPKSEQEIEEELYMGIRKGDLMERIYDEYLHSDLWRERQGEGRNFDWIRFEGDPILEPFMRTQYSIFLEEQGA